MKKMLVSLSLLGMVLSGCGGQDSEGNSVFPYKEGSSLTWNQLNEVCDTFETYNQNGIIYCNKKIDREVEGGLEAWEWVSITYNLKRD